MVHDLGHSYVRDDVKPSFPIYSKPFKTLFALFMNLSILFQDVIDLKLIQPSLLDKKSLIEMQFKDFHEKL